MTPRASCLLPGTPRFLLSLDLLNLAHLPLQGVFAVSVPFRTPLLPHSRVSLPGRPVTPLVDLGRAQFPGDVQCVTTSQPGSSLRSSGGPWSPHCDHLSPCASATLLLEMPRSSIRVQVESPECSVQSQHGPLWASALPCLEAGSFLVPPAEGQACCGRINAFLSCESQ